MVEMWVALLAFLAGSLLNLSVITVFYYRGLTVGDLVIAPRVLPLLIRLGPWLTGKDAKVWVVRERLHRDPGARLPASFRRVRLGLRAGEAEVTRRCHDLDFSMTPWARSPEVGWAPTLLHVAFSLGMGLLAGSLWVGLACYLGLSTHFLAGWLLRLPRARRAPGALLVPVFSHLGLICSPEAPLRSAG
jgi:hypothetical protein